MKLLYDHQIFSIQNYGGISRYFCELMENLIPFPDVSFSLALKYSYNENLLNRSELNNYWSNRNNFFINPVFPLIQKKIHLNVLYHLHINQNESIRLLKKNDFEIFHPTNYNPYFLKHLGKKPFILTVHDMIHELYPEYFPSQDPIKKWKQKLIREAESIIAISHNTKNDIIKFFNIDPDRISVIYHGNPLEFTESSCNKPNIDDHIFNNRYILFVGNRLHYKNFYFFISSISPLFRKYNDISLYCAGGGPFTTKEKNLFKELDILERVRYFAVNDNIMRELYKNAQAFIFPSLYEGFGLPILESFSCGCPVVASNCSSLPEIADDAACYIDPHNAESIIQGVESILTDEDYRDELIRKGNERIKFFSWEKTARETKSVYDKLI